MAASRGPSAAQSLIQLVCMGGSPARRRVGYFEAHRRDLPAVVRHPLFPDDDEYIPLAQVLQVSDVESASGV